jgi:hypothetical protein
VAVGAVAEGIDVNHAGITCARESNTLKTVYAAMKR